MVLKYFSSATPENTATGGSKVIVDIQRTIKKFLETKNISYKEYSYRNLRNIFHLIWPSPHAKYLVFGYIGSPFFTASYLYLCLYFLLFCLVDLKKKIAREKYYVIVVDLIEWQSVIWSTKKNYKFRFRRILQCSMERLLISHIADEVITGIDSEFIKKTYRIDCVRDLELMDYHVNSNIERLSVHCTNLLYAGDLGRSFDVKLLIDVLKNLNSQYRLLVAGYGLTDTFKSELEQFDNFSFLGQLKTDELDLIANQCQFGLIVYPPDFLYYNLIPTTKTSFYIANGLTIISTNLDRMSYLNSKHHFGYVLPKKELLKLLTELSPEMVKTNKELQKRIATGNMLYAVLEKLDFS